MRNEKSDKCTIYNMAVGKTKAVLKLLNSLQPPFIVTRTPEEETENKRFEVVRQKALLQMTANAMLDVAAKIGVTGLERFEE